MSIQEIETSIIQRDISEIQSHARWVRRSCFENCTNLTTASFPDATTIYSSGFENCTNLTTASFPDATTIYSSGFSGCTSLRTASFPNLNTIYPKAFGGCKQLNLSSIISNVQEIKGDYNRSYGPFWSCNMPTTARFDKLKSFSSYRIYVGDSRYFVSDLYWGSTYPGYAYWNTCQPRTYFFPNVTDLCVGCFSGIGEGSTIHVGNKLTTLSGGRQIWQCKDSSGSVSYEYPAAFYFEFSDSDPVSFDASSLIESGTKKSTKSCNYYYTDSSTIYRQLMSKADEYTTVTVHHLDGSDW